MRTPNFPNCNGVVWVTVDHDENLKQPRPIATRRQRHQRGGLVADDTYGADAAVNSASFAAEAAAVALQHYQHRRRPDGISL